MSLDRITAQKRKTLIRSGSIHYNFQIILQKDSYSGLAELSFYLETISYEDNISLDFSGLEIQSLIINNIESDAERQDNFLILPKKYLHKGKNKVSILYRNEYDNDQSGAISFMDGEEQYIYTNFEPYFANRVFPCFDQPNLKAPMRLTVIATEAWTVLSNENPISTSSFQADSYLKNLSLMSGYTQPLALKFIERIKDSNGMKLTEFPSTESLPTYIYCFAVGKYSKISRTYKNLPMSLYYVPSIDKLFSQNADFIFEVTCKCMDLFEQKFKVPYPFSKYDQVFLRQYGFWAMENAGIVTFSEKNMISKDEPTNYHYYMMALVISHQLSHHWFGNYVTMVWWDDLWLNESFAEWISCYSIEYLKDSLSVKFQSSYFYFRDGKNAGYIEDERNNATHPIREEIANTDVAFSIFDGITYEKGAAALKQLFYLVGQDNFFTAIQKYFEAFAWDNATIDDLLLKLEQYFPKQVDVKKWKQTWLLKQSLNVFQTDWDRVNSKITIKQSSFNDNNVLRTHKIKISLFKQDGSFTPLDDLLVLAQETTQFTYTEGPYKAILVNHDDWTFAQNIIDPTSLQFFMRNISDIKELLPRTMVWYNIWSMVKLAKIPLIDYFELIKSKLFSEPSNFLLESLLDNLLQYLSIFIDQNIGNAFRSSIFSTIYKNLEQIEDTDKQRVQILQQQWIKYAYTNKNINMLLIWLNGNDTNLKAKVPSLNQKWEIIKKVFRLPTLSNIQKWDLFNSVRTLDSDQVRVQQSHIICQTILANPTEFEVIYKQLQSPNVSMGTKDLKIQGWRNPVHYDLIISTYQDKMFDDLPNLCQILSYDEFEFLYDNVRPVDHNYQKHIEKYTWVIEELSKFEDMEQHCRNIQKIIDDLTQMINNIEYNSDIDTALTRQRAVAREIYIKKGSIKYTFHISFEKVIESYKGMAQIVFELNEVPEVLHLDCSCKQIYTFKVNGEVLDKKNQDEFIYIPKQMLSIGKNLITVHYRNEYNNDGLGCMSFKQDFESKNLQYIYTKFQPYGAHRFMPCFDQPDLKAPAVYNLIVPDDWIAAANEGAASSGQYSIATYKEKTITNDQTLLNEFLPKGDKLNYYAFQATKVISTYLYCVVAGQYFTLSATEGQLHNNIPMALFCIQSYQNNLIRLSNFIFQMTTLSLALYEQNFMVAYPFSKYDSVFCHEFKSGAMQNPGLITFNDTYLYPEEVSLEKMLQFASTIVHQNSHNWFGNYVTMKWWDDLWLNESFADFIAHFCLQEIKNKVTTINKYDSGWKIFLARGVAGYREDQITPTTHAVRSDVANTSVAQTYFDRITYQKGSATLKQFMFIMGKDKFFLGVQDYFKQFQWSNGTIDDFLGKMATHFQETQFSLDDWKQSWLLSPSLNVFNIQWEENDLRATASMKINQNYYASEYPELRYHKTNIALFKSDGTYDTIENVLIKPEAVTSISYDGRNQYKAILLNWQYWSYYKYSLDPISLNFFKDNLNKIQDTLTRMIIWHDLNEQVRDAKLLLSDFLLIFNKFIFEEKDDKIFQYEFSFIKDALNNYIVQQKRASLKSQVFDSIYGSLANQAIRQDSDNRIKLLKDQLAVFCSDYTQLNKLIDWLEGVNQDLLDEKMKITPSQSWQVVKLCFVSPNVQLPNKWTAYNDVESRYPGTKAELVRNTCNTLLADDNRMEQVYQYFMQTALSLDSKASYSQGWNNQIHNIILLNNFKSRYFTDLSQLSSTMNSNHFEFFYQNLKPIDDKLASTIASYEGINLIGANLRGHIKVITQIKEGYKLRLNLYDYNK